MTNRRPTASWKDNTAAADVIGCAHQAEDAADLPVYLSLTEAAQVMSMSVKTIRRRIADGTIPAYSCGHGSLRIRLDDLENAMQRVPASGRSRQAGSFDAFSARRR